MIPANYDFPSQYKGDTFSKRRFTIINKDTKEPINLVGSSIKIQFKPSSGSTKKTLVTNGGITLIDGSLGIFEIDSFLLDWEQNIYNYDVQITFPDGTIKTYIKGYLEVKQDISN